MEPSSHSILSPAGAPGSSNPLLGRTSTREGPRPPPGTAHTIPTRGPDRAAPRRHELRPEGRAWPARLAYLTNLTYGAHGPPVHTSRGALGSQHDPTLAHVGHQPGRGPEAASRGSQQRADPSHHTRFQPSLGKNSSSVLLGCVGLTALGFSGGR
jgi:hypothetical protein